MAPKQVKRKCLPKESGPSQFAERLHGLAEAAKQIKREQNQTELSNYFEVLRFFQNPPDDSDEMISKKPL